MTEGDKAECRVIAQAECKEIARAIIKEVYLIHVNTCPHGRLLMMAKNRLIGIVIGASLGTGAVSGMTIFGLAKLFTGQ